MNINLDNIPCGESGKWKVSEFEVTEEGAKWHNMRAMMKDGRTISAGKYKQLSRGGKVIMSNTPSEISDHLRFIRLAHGSALINGLGLGMCLTEILRIGKVIDVTVVEKSDDVINIVAPAFAGDSRVSIVHADAFEYNPEKGKYFNAVWHDIWDDICTDNLPQMTKLHRKYGRRCEWQGSWVKELLTYQKQKERRGSRWSRYA